jgi:hypothetical protein
MANALSGAGVCGITKYEIRNTNPIDRECDGYAFKEPTQAE